MSVVLLAFLGFMALVAILAFGASVILSRRDKNDKAQRKELLSASSTINAIDTIVSRYYPMSDLVGQSMGDEIRTEIHEHRKVITTK